MAIDFPASPTNGQTHTVGSTTWTWDGTKWGITSGAAGATDNISEGNTTAEVIDTGSDGRFVVTTEGTERLRVDANGRLGIGTASPGSLLEIKSPDQNPNVVRLYNAYNAGGSSWGIDFYRDSNSGTNLATAEIKAVREGGEVTSLKFGTSSTSGTVVERMRIGSNGTTFFGTGLGTNLATTEPVKIAGNCGDRGGLLTMRDDGLAGANRDFIRFHDSSNNDIGAIEHTGGSSVAYLTSSDYRLKENVIPLANAVDRIKQLPVHRFNFISDPNRTVDGFLAHEAQVVVPECVSGEKDAVDDEGNPVYQGIDQSKLVPLLTAALQEAVARIEAQDTTIASLEARLTTLEGGN